MSINSLFNEKISIVALATILVVTAVTFFPHDVRAATYSGLEVSDSTFSNPPYNAVCIVDTAWTSRSISMTDYRVRIAYTTSGGWATTTVNTFFGRSGPGPNCTNTESVIGWNLGISSGSTPGVVTGDMYLYVEDLNSSDVFYSSTFTFDSGTNLLTAYTPPADTTTRIDEVFPYDGEQVATSSLPFMVEAIGYVNEDDFKPGSRLRFKIDRNSDYQAAGVGFVLDAGWGNWTNISINSDGAFDYSTSDINTTFPLDRIGLYHMRTVIEVPAISVFGLNFTYRQLVSTTTQFTIATTTALDKVQISTGAVLDELVEGASDPFANCQFDFTALDFSLPTTFVKCVYGITASLFVPNQTQIATLFDDEKEVFLSKPPFAYVYLSYQAISSYESVATSTTDDSNLTITLPDTGAFASSTATVSLAGETITFIDWEQLATSVDSLRGNAYYAGLMDFINFMMLVAFLYWCWSFAIRNFVP